MQPNISIIIPVYNSENYIKSCLDSIIRQTFESFEVILVDDGSTDRSPNICDQYVQTDKRFNVIHKENQGVTCARIDGYKAAKGDFIFFLDSDDYIADNALEILLKAQKESNADVVVCNICEVRGSRCLCRRQLHNCLYDRKEIDEHLKSSFLYDFRINMAEIPLYLWGKLFRRSVLQNALEQGLDLWYEEDLVSVVYVLYNINSLQIIENKLYYYVMHSGQVTSKDPVDISLQMKKSRDTVSSFDTRHLLEEQLLYRNYGHVRYILSRISNKDSSYKVFKHFFLANVESEEMRSFFHSAYSPIRTSDKLTYILLKYRKFRIYYIILRIYLKLKKYK